MKRFDSWSRLLTYSTPILPSGQRNSKQWKSCVASSIPNTMQHRPPRNQTRQRPTSSQVKMCYTHGLIQRCWNLFSMHREHGVSPKTNQAKNAKQTATKLQTPKSPKPLHSQRSTPKKNTIQKHASCVQKCLHQWAVPMMHVLPCAGIIFPPYVATHAAPWIVSAARHGAKNPTSEKKNLLLFF